MEIYHKNMTLIFITGILFLAGFSEMVFSAEEAPGTLAPSAPPETTPSPAPMPVLLMPPGDIGIILIFLIGISAGIYFFINTTRGK